jgi:hypothetical protein
MALVKRDSFARQETHRERVYGNDKKCRNCDFRNVTKGGRKFVYQYRVETDGGRKHDITGLYCSAQCFKIFNT